MNTFVRTGLILSLPIALSACSSLSDTFSQETIQYETSDSRAPLEIPPDMNSVPMSDRYSVPTRPQTVWASQQQAEQNAEQGNSAPVSQVLPVGEVAQIMREGNNRWIHVNLPMETNWAENRAKLPQDIIRATLGKVIDMVYSTGERDQYRARLERSETGGTDIYVTHRSMVEVVKNISGDNDTTVWQPGPTDPEMEAEMITRLSQRINAEFDPHAVAASKQEHQKQVEELAAYQPTESISQLEQGADGVATSIFIKEGFERAWRRVALAIDRMGFTVEDRDRSRGFFLVRYLDEQYEEEQRSQQGFWKNVFSRDTPVEAPQYVIYLQPISETETRVHVLGPDGKADTTGVAPKILTLLSEQTR